MQGELVFVLQEGIYSNDRVLFVSVDGGDQVEEGVILVALAS